jgi:hypothetical protein
MGFRRMAQRPRNHSDAHFQDQQKKFIFMFKNRTTFLISKDIGLFEARYWTTWSVEQNSRCRHAIYTEIGWKPLNMIIFTSIWTAPKQNFAIFHSPDFIGLSKKLIIVLWCGKIEWYHLYVQLKSSLSNCPLVVKQFIETMDSLHVQGTKKT